MSNQYGQNTNINQLTIATSITQSSLLPFQATTSASLTNGISVGNLAVAVSTGLLLGSMATQNANAVTITGGTINGTSIGASSRSSGAFTTLSATGTFTATGVSITGGTVTASGGTLTAYTAITTGSLTATAATITGGTLSGLTSVGTATLTATAGLTVSAGAAAITGDSTITGTLTANSFIPTATAAISNGLSLSAANTPSITANSLKVVDFVSVGSSSRNLTFTNSNGATPKVGTSAGGLALDAAGTIRAIVDAGPQILLGPATTIPAGGTLGAGYLFSSTLNFGIFFGSSAPTLVAAQGSLYLRSDGTATNTRAYIATSATSSWTPITTVA